LFVRHAAANIWGDDDPNATGMDETGTHAPLTTIKGRFVVRADALRSSPGHAHFTQILHAAKANSLFKG
jgi:hypothetical protein